MIPERDGGGIRPAVPRYPHPSADYLDSNVRSVIAKSKLPHAP